MGLEEGINVGFIDVKNKRTTRSRVQSLKSKYAVKRLCITIHRSQAKIWSKVSLNVFQKLKYNFSHLEYFVLNNGKLKTHIYASLLKQLKISTPNLKCVCFRQGNLNVGVLYGLYTLSKFKSETKRPINLQLYRIYRHDFIDGDVSIMRGGYLLSLAGRYCKNILHTQTDGPTNQALLKLFLTSSEIAKRKSKISYISLGVCYKSSNRVFLEIWEQVKVWGNPQKCYCDIIRDRNEEFLENITISQFT